MPNTEQRTQTVRKSADSAPAAPDRRVRRTRKLLHDAFISLVIEKGYVVFEGPSTLSTLLTANFDAMHEQLEHELDQIAATGPIDVALPAALLFEHAYRNQRVYRAMCGRQGGELVQRHLRRLIGDVLRKRLGPQLQQSGAEVPADVAAEFYTSAALGLLVWWIDKDFCGDDAWMSELYRKLAA